MDKFLDLKNRSSCIRAEQRDVTKMLHTHDEGPEFQKFALNHVKNDMKRSTLINSSQKAALKR